MICTYCENEASSPDKWLKCPERELIAQMPLCWTCAYTIVRIKANKPCIILNGQHYAVARGDYLHGTYNGFTCDVVFNDGSIGVHRIGWKHNIPMGLIQAHPDLYGDTVTGIVTHYAPLVITEQDIEAEDSVDNVGFRYMVRGARFRPVVHYLGGRAITSEMIDKNGVRK